MPGLGVVAHQPALHRHGQLVNEGRVHEPAFRGVEPGPRQLIGHVVGGHHAQVVALRHMGSVRHADGEHLALQDVFSGLVSRAQAQGQLGSVADAAPGGVHGVRRAVRAVGSHDEHRLGVGVGLGPKIFTHQLSLLIVIVNAILTNNIGNPDSCRHTALYMNFLCCP